MTECEGAAGTHKKVTRQYMFSMLGTSLGYAGSLIGVTFALRNWEDVSMPIIIALATIPGIFLFGMILSFWRYVRDIDEVARHFIVQSMILGLFAILALSGIWGLIEMLTDDVPRLPIFWVFPLFFGAFGLAACFGPGRGMGLK